MTGDPPRHASAFGQLLVAVAMECGGLDQGVAEQRVEDVLAAHGPDEPNLANNRTVVCEVLGHRGGAHARAYSALGVLQAALAEMPMPPAHGFDRDSTIANIGHLHLLSLQRLVLTHEALPCPDCGRAPSQVVDGSGAVTGYLEDHLPDCPRPFS